MANSIDLSPGSASASSVPESRIDEKLSRLRTIIAEKCVLSSENGWLVSPSGHDNGWLIDMRQAFLDAEALDICSDLFWDSCESMLPFQLGGLEIAAIPLVVALLLKARDRGLVVSGFILRKERKSYGVGKVVEGKIGPEPIFVVDDIMNSGNTLEKTRVLLASFGRQIDHAFVVVDYESSAGTEWAKTHHIRPFSFFSLSDFGLSNIQRPSRPVGCFEDIWTFTSEKANHFHVVPKSSPVIDDGKVIFGSDRGTLWALDAATGAEIWRFQIKDPGRKGIWSRPVAQDGRIYFGAYDGNLYCLNGETGQEIWSNGDADWIGSSPIIGSDEGLLWIGLEHGRPNAQGSVAAFDPISGEKCWERYLPEYVHGTAAYSRRYGAIAIGANDGKLYQFDARSGETRWEFLTGGAIKEAPIFDERRGLIYFAGFDGFIRAVDAEHGSLVWAIEAKNWFYSTPLLLGDYLFVSGTDKNLHVIDLERARHKTIGLASKSVSTPVAIDQSVFVGSNGGVVFEIDAEGNGIVGRHQLPNPMTNRVAYCEKTKVFFGLTYMNELYAFRRAMR